MFIFAKEDEQVESEKPIGLINQYEREKCLTRQLRRVDFNDRVPDELKVRFSLMRTSRETELIVTINHANYITLCI